MWVWRMRVNWASRSKVNPRVSNSDASILVFLISVWSTALRVEGDWERMKAFALYAHDLKPIVFDVPSKVSNFKFLESTSC